MVKKLAEAGIPILMPDGISRLEHRNLNSTKELQETLLAEIFFELALGISKMSELGIAHQNIKPENIWLDYFRKPFFSQFESAVEHADPKLLAKDLKALGKVMETCINPETPEWVPVFSKDTQLLELRKKLYELAVDTGNGKISTIDELINSLLDIYPELLEDGNQNLAPAVPMS